MKKLKTLAHLGMLITTSLLFAYPQNPIPHVAFQKTHWLEDLWRDTQIQTIEWIRPTTYDGIMQMLNDLEFNELEKRCSLESSCSE